MSCCGPTGPWQRCNRNGGPERPGQFRQLQQLDFRICARTIRSRALKRDRRDRIFAAGDTQKSARQSKLAAAKFKNRLPRQQMDRVSERLRTPKQPIINNWIVLPPVFVAISLTDRQGRDKRRAIFGNG